MTVGFIELLVAAAFHTSDVVDQQLPGQIAKTQHTISNLISRTMNLEAAAAANYTTVQQAAQQPQQHNHQRLPLLRHHLHMYKM